MSVHRTKSIQAIAAATEASREYGIASSKTALAWKAFEESISDDYLAP